MRWSSSKSLKEECSTDNSWLQTSKSEMSRQHVHLHAHRWRTMSGPMMTSCITRCLPRPKRGTTTSIQSFSRPMIVAMACQTVRPSRWRLRRPCPRDGRSAASCSRWNDRAGGRPPARARRSLLQTSSLDPSRKSGGALHRLHCFCLEFDGACEVQRRVPTDWIIEPVDVSGHGSFSLAS